MKKLKFSLQKKDTCPICDFEIKKKMYGLSIISDIIPHLSYYPVNSATLQNFYYETKSKELLPIEHEYNVFKYIKKNLE